MQCIKCGMPLVASQTTDVMEFGTSLLIVRNVPCFKCPECSEIIYTAEVVKQLEKIYAEAHKFLQEVSIVDFSQVA